MAASVLLGSADNTGLLPVGGASSGPRAGGVPGGGNSGPGSVAPAPWNRSLDRALDEAAASGCLNLSGRKLKEFPRGAAGHDLTDTTRAGRRPGPARSGGGFCGAGRDRDQSRTGHGRSGSEPGQNPAGAVSRASSWAAPAK